MIEENDLVGYQQVAEAEQSKMFEQFRLVKSMIEENKSLAERLEKIKLSEYFMQALQTYE